MHRTKALVPGVIADIILPFSNLGEPDWERLGEEVKTLDRAGVSGLCIGGLLGGTIGSTPEELGSLCEAVKRASNKPLFAAVFPDASPEACEMVRAVDGGGADAILVSQPHYLAQPDPNGLEQLFADLRELTERPLLVADCLPDSILGVKAIRQLVHAQLVDGVLEAADMHVLVDLLGLHLEVPVYSGVEDLHYLGMVLGAHGLVSDLACVLPEDSVSLYAAIEEGDHSRARTIHERLVRVWRAANFGTEREARLRAALAARGRNVGAARSPYAQLPSATGEQIRGILRKENLLLETS